jgi:hypothetical protein
MWLVHRTDAGEEGAGRLRCRGLARRRRSHHAPQVLVAVRVKHGHGGRRRTARPAAPAVGLCLCLCAHSTHARQTSVPPPCHGRVTIKKSEACTPHLPGRTYRRPWRYEHGRGRGQRGLSYQQLARGVAVSVAPTLFRAKNTTAKQKCKRVASVVQYTT